MDVTPSGGVSTVAGGLTVLGGGGDRTCSAVQRFFLLLHMMSAGHSTTVRCVGQSAVSSALISLFSLVISAHIWPSCVDVFSFFCKKKENNIIVLDKSAGSVLQDK